MNFHWKLSQYILHTHTRKVSVKWLVQSFPSINIPKSTYESIKKNKCFRGTRILRFSIWVKVTKTPSNDRLTAIYIRKHKKKQMVSMEQGLSESSCALMQQKYWFQGIVSLTIFRWIAGRLNIFFSLLNFNSRILYHAAAT